MPREVQPGSGDFSIPFKSNSLQIIAKGQRLVVRPSWDFTILLFRPIPVKDKDGNVSEFIEGNQLGYWFGSGFLEANISNGSRTAKMIIKHKFDGVEVLQTSPAYILAKWLGNYARAKMYKNMGNLNKFERVRSLLTPGIWEIYEKDADTNVSIREQAYVQALIYANKSSPIYPPEGWAGPSPIPIVDLSKTAADAVSSIIYASPDGYPTNIIGVDGRFVEIGRYGYDKTKLFPTTGKQGNNSYEARLFAAYKDFNAKIEEGKMQELVERTTPWEDTCTLLEPQEEMNIIVWTEISPAYIYGAMEETELGNIVEVPQSIIRKGRQLLGKGPVVQGVTPNKITGQGPLAPFEDEEDEDDDGGFREFDYPDQREFDYPDQEEEEPDYPTQENESNETPIALKEPSEANQKDVSLEDAKKELNRLIQERRKRRNQN